MQGDQGPGRGGDGRAQIATVARIAVTARKICTPFFIASGDRLFQNSRESFSSCSVRLFNWSISMSSAPACSGVGATVASMTLAAKAAERLLGRMANILLIKPAAL